MLKSLSLDSNREMLEWDDFVRSHPAGSPYHLSDWLRTLCDTYSFEPFLYAEVNPEGDLAGVLPFLRVKSLGIKGRLVSIPFSDMGGPLFQDDELAGKALD